MIEYAGEFGCGRSGSFGYFGGVCISVQETRPLKNVPSNFEAPYSGEKVNIPVFFFFLLSLSVSPQNRLSWLAYGTALHNASLC